MCTITFIFTVTGKRSKHKNSYLLEKTKNIIMSLLNSFNRPPTGEKLEGVDEWKYNKSAVNRPWVKGYKPKKGAPEYVNGVMLDPKEKEKL